MSVWFGIVVVILICSVAVLALHQSRKIAEKSFSTLNRIHARQSKQLDKSLDRLMTIRWEDLVALQTLQQDDEGGFVPPEDQDEEKQEDGDTRWGHLRRLHSDALNLSDEENELLNEDFPDASEG